MLILHVFLLATGTYITWYVGMLGPVARGAQVVAGEGIRHAANTLRSQGIDVDGIMDGSAIKNATLTLKEKGPAARLKAGQKAELFRNASSPSSLGADGEGEGIEMNVRGGARRRKGGGASHDDE